MLGQEEGESVTNLGACDHDAVTEAQVKDGLTVVDKGVHHLPRLHVPYSAMHTRQFSLKSAAYFIGK
jgi:hypothetical protein